MNLLIEDGKKLLRLLNFDSFVLDLTLLPLDDLDIMCLIDLYRSLLYLFFFFQCFLLAIRTAENSDALGLLRRVDRRLGRGLEDLVVRHVSFCYVAGWDVLISRSQGQFWWHLVRLLLLALTFLAALVFEGRGPCRLGWIWSQALLGWGLRYIWLLV